MKKLRDLKKVLSYLELQGQGRGIIMEVTRPLLVGPFYILLGKMAYHTKQIRRQCTSQNPTVGCEFMPLHAMMGQN